MTWVKSRLVGPTGLPIEGVCVKAALVSTPTWLVNSTSQVGGRAMTHTGPDGLWRLDLLPFTSFESQLAGCAYYRITESASPPIVTTIRVPEAADGEELWMRDLVFDPDPCSNSNGFIAINTLARLHDVDAPSLALAKPGDFLVLLPNGKWGAAHGPMPLTISWTPDPDDMLTVNVTVVGFGGAGARVGFGDGSPEITVSTLEPVTHTYDGPGTYIITATDVAWPAFTGSVKVGVKDHLPRVHAFRDADDDWRILLWVDEDADDSVYAIDWGDNTPIVETRGQNINVVPPRPRVLHQYSSVGPYQVLVTDLSTKRQSTKHVEVGEIGSLITFDTDARPRSEWLWMAVGSTWEFQSEGELPVTGVVPYSGIVNRPSALDLAPGDYGMTIREVFASEVRRTATRRVVVPTQQDWRMDVDMTWRALDDPLGYQTVTVTPNGARTRCTVEWGDGSSSDLVEPGETASHRYQLPAPTAGWRLRLVETQIEDPRTWTRVLGEPRYVGTPIMSARSRGAVDVDVAGIDHDHNDDWYAITWDETGTPEPMAAVGRWYPAQHVYTTPGLKQITLDGPGMESPIEREVEVVFYPTPTITALEELDSSSSPVDPTRMTARLSVDNSASGGPCTVRLGDGSTPRPCAEVDSFIYQYSTPGTFYPIVTSDADLTARGRTKVAVPFQTVRTLYYDLTGVPGGYEVTCSITAKKPGTTVQVQWESGGPWNMVPPGDEVAYYYPIDGTYEVRVAYTDDSELWSTTIVIPWL